MSLDILAEGLVHQRLIAATALLVHTLLESGQDIFIEADGNAIFCWRQGVERPMLGAGGIIDRFRNLFRVLIVGIAHNNLSRVWWHAVPKSGV